jgi:hypothetical protein
MSLATLEKAILAELKTVTDNPKLTKNSIMEWANMPVKAEEGEILAYLPELMLHVAYKPKK